MVIFYLVATVASVLRNASVTEELAAGQNPFIFAIKSGLTFAVGVAIVYAGVRMILADLIPAFQGIANKLIPNAIPAVDCAVFFLMRQPLLSSVLRQVSLVAYLGC